MSWGGGQALVKTEAGYGVFVSAEGTVIGSPFTIHPLTAPGRPSAWVASTGLVAGGGSALRS